MSRLILSKERALFERREYEEPSRINDVHDAVVNEVHMFDFRARFQHLLKVVIDLQMQAAYDFRDEHLVLFNVWWLEQGILDEECLEPLNLLLLSRIDEFDAKLGRQFFEELVLPERRLGGVDVLLGRLVEHIVEFLTLVQLTHTNFFDLPDYLLQLFPVFGDVALHRLLNIKLVNLVEEVGNVVHVGKYDNVEVKGFGEVGTVCNAVANRRDRLCDEGEAPHVLLYHRQLVTCLLLIS